MVSWLYCETDGYNIRTIVLKMIEFKDTKKPNFDYILKHDRNPLVHCVPLSNRCSNSAIHEEYRTSLKLNKIDRQPDFQIGNVTEVICKHRRVFCLVTRDNEDVNTKSSDLMKCFNNLTELIANNEISEISLHKESFDGGWSKVYKTLRAAFRNVDITVNVYETGTDKKHNQKEKQKQKGKKIVAKLRPEEPSDRDQDRPRRVDGSSSTGEKKSQTNVTSVNCNQQSRRDNRPQTGMTIAAKPRPEEPSDRDQDRSKQVDRLSSTGEKKSQTNVTSVNCYQQSRRDNGPQTGKFDSSYQYDNQGRQATTKEETADYFNSLICKGIKEIYGDSIQKYSNVVFTSSNFELNRELLRPEFLRNKNLKVPEVCYSKGQYCVAICSRGHYRVSYVTLMEALIRLRRKCLAQNENRIVIRTDDLRTCLFQFSAMNVKSLIYMVFLNSEIDVFITPFTNGKLNLSYCFKLQKNSSHLDIITGNLFSCPKSYALAHCVAEDLLMGAGIAVEFKKRFNNVNYLYNQYQYTGGLAKLVHGAENGGNKRNIYYLITKAVSRGKPTHETLLSSLIQMRIDCENDSVTNLAMPMIGCGLDRLKWPIVENMILSVFSELNISIQIYTLDDPYYSQNTIDSPTTSVQATETGSCISEKSNDGPISKESVSSGKQKTETMIISPSADKHRS